MKKLVIASNNPGKLRELVPLLARMGIEAVPQADLGVGEAEEPHHTFLENALAKARHASRATGLAALADDSGLVVPALGGAPGVHSAHYAGHEGDRGARDARNNQKLLGELAGKPDRSAYYYCVLVLVRETGDPTPIVADGRWHGHIVSEPRGTNGFGYDPLFLIPEYHRTFGELSATVKHALSHRGRALAQLRPALRRLTPLGSPSPTVELTGPAHPSA